MPAAGLQIADLDPGDPDVQRLIAASDALMTALYPAESNHFDGVETLRRPNVRFLAARLDGRVIGCGAVKRLLGPPAYGEIKRVYVDPASRGQGIAQALMAVLEDSLRAAGIGLARLETGIHQPEAIGLYRRLGYAERAPFGDYRPDPLSLFMEKQLA